MMVMDVDSPECVLHGLDRNGELRNARTAFTRSQYFKVHDMP